MTHQGIFSEAQGSSPSKSFFLSGLVPYAKRYMPHALIALAVCSGFFYVYVFGVDLYWGDDWMVRPSLYSQHAHGTLTVDSLWREHNEHRIVFPKLIMLALASVFQGNAIPNMYFTQVLLTAILCCFLIAYGKQFPRDRAVWLMVPVAYLVFCFRQYENMLWAFQIAFVMVVPAALLTFLCLSRLRNERYSIAFSVSLLGATVGAFSSIQGLMIWPIGLGQLLIGTLTKRRKIVLASIWVLVGMFEWILYFQGWHSPGHHPTIQFSPHYLLLILGGSFSGDVPCASVIGAVLAILATSAIVMVFIRRQWQQHSFLLATAAFSLMTLIAITLGRSGFGPDQSLASRYSTYSLPLVIATFLLFASQSRNHPDRWSIYFSRATLAVIFIGIAIGSYQGWAVGREWFEERMYQRFVLFTIESQPDDAIHFFPAQHLRPLAAIMKELHYSVYGDEQLAAHSELPPASLPASAIPAECDVNDAYVESNGTVLVILGWAIDAAAHKPADSVSLEIDGKTYPACYGLYRSDICRHYRSLNLAYSGFRCPIRFDDVGPGKHSVTLKIRSCDRNTIYQTAKQFEIHANATL